MTIKEEITMLNRQAEAIRRSREEMETELADIEQEARLRDSLCCCCDQRPAIVMVEGDKLCEVCRPHDAYTAEERLAYYRSLIDGPGGNPMSERFCLHYKRLGPEPKCSNPDCEEISTRHCDACDKPYCRDCSHDFEGSWQGDTTQCHNCTDGGIA